MFLELVGAALKAAGIFAGLWIGVAMWDRTRKRRQSRRIRREAEARQLEQLGREPRQ